MTDLARTEAILADLVAFPTVSADSNLDLIAYVEALLGDLGARVRVQLNEATTKANIFATLGPEGDGGIVLSGHTDVVPVADQAWTTDPFEMAVRDDRLYGRGTCDMKGFIAATLAMAGEFSQLDLKRPLHFAFTYDEEVGCLGAQALLAELARTGPRPSMAIIGEPTEMRVISGHKGCREYTTRITGLEGHGSAPDQGVNAVEYAARYVDHLLDLREELKGRAPPGSRFEPPFSTLNVGRIEGGVAANVIASAARVDWDFRAVQSEDLDFIDRREADFVQNVLLPAMRRVFSGASIETELHGDVAGFLEADDSEAVRVVAALTGANGTDVVAFGTEAGLFHDAGTSAVVCGPGSIAQAHKADEFVARSQLAACLEMHGGLRARLV